MAVDAQFVVAQGGDIDARIFHLALDREYLAKLVPFGGAADPRGLPIEGLEERHAESRGPAVVAGRAFLVPVAHLPPVIVAAFEGLAGIGDLDGVVAGHLARIPLVGAVL